MSNLVKDKFSRFRPVDVILLIATELRRFDIDEGAGAASNAAALRRFGGESKNMENLKIGKRINSHNRAYLETLKFDVYSSYRFQRSKKYHPLSFVDCSTDPH